MGDLHNPQQCSPKISSPTHQIPNACTNSPSIDPDSISICPEFESRTGQLVSVSDHDLRNGGLQKLESNSPKKRKPKKKRFCCCSSSKKQNGEKVGAGGKLCNCAASFGGDCAAVFCCCPCALLHLGIVVLVKFPLCFAKKAFFCARKSIPKEEEKEEDKKEEWRCYTPPWSREESPQRSNGAVDGLPCSTSMENQKIWSDLYAGGQLGFGGLLFERSRGPQLPSPI